MKPFRVLRGRRIIIEVPVKKESAIKLTEKDEDAIMYEAMKAWLKLRVFAVGEKCEDIAEGDMVYIPYSALEHSEKIDIDGTVRLVLNEGDVAIVW
tara:strand:+ start:753 stop:1040 length:288 start_codon:yes stop_codon:yes gene_type:complete